MELREQQRRGWLYTCTRDERLALFGTMGTWAREVGARTDLDPLESRAMYRVFARELGQLVEREYSTRAEPDRAIRRQWGRLGGATQATWIRAVGGWFEWDSPGREAADVISASLSPPRFMSLPQPQQRDVLNQVDTEIRTYLKNDPHWYGAQTEAYRNLAKAITGVRRPDQESAHWHALRWSHVDTPQRGMVLQDIAAVAHRGANSRSVDAATRGHLQDLTRSADWVADLHRPRVLVRE